MMRIFDCSLLHSVLVTLYSLVVSRERKVPLFALFQGRYPGYDRDFPSRSACVITQVI